MKPDERFGGMLANFGEMVESFHQRMMEDQTASTGLCKVSSRQ
jgi:hypothetical protein